MKKTKIKNTGEYVYTEKLKNGLEVIMIPNNKVKNFYLTLNVKFGSIHTNFKFEGKNHKLPKGIAHFLEHLMFNMPDKTSAFEYYSKIGSNINAFTTYEYTSYEVYANSKFKENLSYLLKYVYTPYFTKEIVSGEKGIITEEIKMISDNPAAEIVYGMYRNVFVKDERKYLIAGTVDDIKSITLDDIKLAYDAFYHPENMFLVITGNFDPTEAVAIATETLSNFEFPKYEKPVIKKYKEPAKVATEYFEKEMPVDMHKVTIALKIPKSNFKDLELSNLELKMYLSLIIRINFGNTSLLKEELLSGSIISDSISYHLTDTLDHFVIAILANTDYPDYFMQRINEKLLDLSISKEEIERKIKTSISNLILCFDEIKVVNSDIQDDLVYEGKFIHDIYDYYQDINIESASKVLEKLKNHEKSVTIIKPKE